MTYSIAVGDPELRSYVAFLDDSALLKTLIFELRAAKRPSFRATLTKKENIVAPLARLPQAHK